MNNTQSSVYTALNIITNRSYRMEEAEFPGSTVKEVALFIKNWEEITGESMNSFIIRTKALARLSKREQGEYVIGSHRVRGLGKFVGYCLALHLNTAELTKLYNLTTYTEDREPLERPLIDKLNRMKVAFLNGASIKESNYLF